MQVIDSTESSWMMYSNNVMGFSNQHQFSNTNPIFTPPIFPTSSSFFPPMYNNNNTFTNFNQCSQAHIPFLSNYNTFSEPSNGNTPTIVINEQDADDDIIMRDDASSMDEGASDIVNISPKEQSKGLEELVNIENTTSVVPFKLDNLLPYFTKQMYKKYCDVVSKLILDGKISPRFSTGTIPLPLPYNAEETIPSSDDATTPSIIIEEIDETEEQMNISPTTTNSTYTVTETILPSQHYCREKRPKLAKLNRTHEKRPREESSTCSTSTSPVEEQISVMNTSFAQQLQMDSIKKRKLI